MKEKTVRKFRDLAIGTVKAPEMNKVHAAFRSIATLPAGQVIETWLLDQLAAIEKPDCSDGASKELRARRIMAREIVAMMNKDPANDGPDERADPGRTDDGRRRHKSSPGFRSQPDPGRPDLSADD